MKIMGKVKQQDKAVQETNDSSIVSKCSMVKMGYFSDPAVPMFVDKSCRRSPLIHRGYYIRAKAVAKTVDTFLNLYRENCQVLVIGAGFDSTYFRLSMESKLHPGTVFYEVDFLDVVKRKRDLILSNMQLEQCLSCKTHVPPVSDECIVLNTANYKLISANVKDPDLLEERLLLCNIDLDIPTLILSECVLSYLDSESGSKIIRWASGKFKNAVFATYEQIHPEDGFGIVMCSHFQSLQSPLKSVRDYPTAKGQIQRYLDNGWERCIALDMNTYRHHFITDEDRMTVDGIEPFDEFEEWTLKCNHYVIVWAACGRDGAEFLSTVVAPRRDPLKTTPRGPCPKMTICLNRRKDVGGISRYGHASVLFDGFLISYGGFGDHEGRHGRLNNMHCTELATGRCFKWHPSLIVSADFRIHHTMTLLSDGRLLVYGGRASPSKPCTNMMVLSPTKIVREKQSEEDTNTSECCVRLEDNCDLSPCPRWRHSASSVHCNGKEMVLIFGGRSVHEECLNDFYLLDTSCWKWEKQIPNKENQPCARHSHSSASWNNDKVIISCGLDTDGHPLSDIHMFDGSDKQWHQLFIDGIRPRYSHSSHVHRNKLYLVGGTNCTPSESPDITVVDLLTYAVHELQFPPQRPESPLILVNHDSVIDEQTNEIIIIGGGGNCFSFGTHFNQGSVYISI